MKTIKLILTIAGLLTSVLSHAQTFSGQYQSATTQHYKNGLHTSNTTKFKPGAISVTRESINIDTVSYVIVKHGGNVSEDEGQFSQSLVIMTTTKKGGYKALDCVLLLKPDKSISEVILKKTKATVVSYLIK